MDDEKRSEGRDPGEHDQNLAIEKGLPAMKPTVEGADVVMPSKCPKCGRDSGGQVLVDPPVGKCECGRDR